MALSPLTQQLRQLGDIHRDPPSLVFGEQLGSGKNCAFPAPALLREDSNQGCNGPLTVWIADQDNGKLRPSTIIALPTLRLLVAAVRRQVAQLAGALARDRVLVHHHIGGDELYFNATPHPSPATSPLIAALALPQRKKPQQVSCWG